MTTKTTNNIKAIILGLVLTVGIGYAAAATFVGPKCAPPGCNADAPVTVGGNDVGITPYSQIKTGILSLMHLITPDLTVTNSDGVTPVTVGHVLTAKDTTGKVEWAPASAAGGGGAIVFINPVNLSSTLSAWATYSGSAVPAGASAVILEATYSFSNSSPGAINVSATGSVRKDSAGSVYTLLADNTRLLNPDQFGGSNQGIFPVSASGQFDYNLSAGASAKIIGYIINGSGSIPGGLIVGGYRVKQAMLSPYTTTIESPWGVATASGCPSAYKTLKSGDDGQSSNNSNAVYNYSLYQCVTQ